jgi:hypothetical protein
MLSGLPPGAIVTSAGDRQVVLASYTVPATGRTTAVVMLVTPSGGGPYTVLASCALEVTTAQGFVTQTTPMAVAVLPPVAAANTPGLPGVSVGTVTVVAVGAGTITALDTGEVLSTGPSVARVVFPPAAYLGSTGGCGSSGWVADTAAPCPTAVLCVAPQAVLVGNGAEAPIVPASEVYTGVTVSKPPCEEACPALVGPAPPVIVVSSTAAVVQGDANVGKALLRRLDATTLLPVPFPANPDQPYIVCTAVGADPADAYTRSVTLVESVALRAYLVGVHVAPTTPVDDVYPGNAVWAVLLDGTQLYGYQTGFNDPVTGLTALPTTSPQGALVSIACNDGEGTTYVTYDCVGPAGTGWPSHVTVVAQYTPSTQLNVGGFGFGGFTTWFLPDSQASAPKASLAVHTPTGACGASLAVGGVSVTPTVDADAMAAVVYGPPGKPWLDTAAPQSTASSTGPGAVVRPFVLYVTSTGGVSGVASEFGMGTPAETGDTGACCPPCCTTQPVLWTGALTRTTGGPTGGDGVSVFGDAAWRSLAPQQVPVLLAANVGSLGGGRHGAAPGRLGVWNSARIALPVLSTSACGIVSVDGRYKGAALVVNGPVTVGDTCGPEDAPGTPGQLRFHAGALQVFQGAAWQTVTTSVDTPP